MSDRPDERKRSKLHQSGHAWREGTLRLGTADKKLGATEKKKLTENKRLDGLRGLFAKGKVGGSIAHSERWHEAYATAMKKVDRYVRGDPEARRGKKAYAALRREVGKLDDPKTRSVEARVFQAGGPRLKARKIELHHFEFPKKKYRDSATDPEVLYPVRRPGENRKPESRSGDSSARKRESVHTRLHRLTGKEGRTKKGAPALFNEMAILDKLPKPARRSFQRHLEHQSSASVSLEEAKNALARNARKRRLLAPNR